MTFVAEFIVALVVVAAVGAFLDHRKTRWTGTRAVNRRHRHD